MIGRNCDIKLPIFILCGLSTTTLKTEKFAKIPCFPPVFSVRNKWYINRLKYNVCYMYSTTHSNTLNYSALCTPRCVFGLCMAIRMNSVLFPHTALSNGLCNEHALCFLWGRNWIVVCRYYLNRDTLCPVFAMQCWLKHWATFTFTLGKITW
jgi:hypothetical protein